MKYLLFIISLALLSSVQAQLIDVGNIPEPKIQQADSLMINLAEVSSPADHRYYINFLTGLKPKHWQDKINFVRAIDNLYNRNLNGAFRYDSLIKAPYLKNRLHVVFNACQTKERFNYTFNKNSTIEVRYLKLIRTMYDMDEFVIPFQFPDNIKFIQLLDGLEELSLFSKVETLQIQADIKSKLIGTWEKQYFEKYSTLLKMKHDKVAIPYALSDTSFLDVLCYYAANQINNEPASKLVPFIPYLPYNARVDITIRALQDTAQKIDFLAYVDYQMDLDLIKQMAKLKLDKKRNERTTDLDEQLEKATNRKKLALIFLSLSFCLLAFSFYKYRKSIKEKRRAIQQLENVFNEH